MANNKWLADSGEYFIEHDKLREALTGYDEKMQEMLNRYVELMMDFKGYKKIGQDRDHVQYLKEEIRWRNNTINRIQKELDDSYDIYYNMKGIDNEKE